ncbi:MAG: PQQ-binding-like beta-propeller repeat protein [Acidobacteriota bacterium]
MACRTSNRIPRLVALLLAVGLVGACARSVDEVDDESTTPSDRPPTAAVDAPSDPSDPVDAAAVEPDPPAAIPAVWTVATGGEVWSSPTRVDDDTAAFGSDDGVLRIVDLATGRVRAEQRLDGRLRGRPASVDGHVIATSDDGSVHALDATTGALLWSRSIDASVPAIGVDTAGLVVTIDTSGRAIGLAATDGARRWRGPVGSARAAATSVGQRILIVTTDGVVHGLDTAGEIVWRAEIGAETAPVAADGMVAAVCKGCLVALDANDGTERWRARVGEFVGAPPASVGGRLWVATGDGWLIAFDTGSGAELWRRRLDGPVRGSPAPASEVTFLAIGEHRLIGLDTVTGDGRWRFDTDTWITGALASFATDSAARRVLFGGVDGGLYGVLAELPTLDRPPRPAPELTIGPSFFDGEPAIRWQVDLDRPVVAAPSIAAGAVLIAMVDGIVALDLANGSERWRAAGSSSSAAPASAGRAIYHGDLAGVLRAMDLRSGQELWHRELGAPIRNPPVLVGARLAVATDGGLHVLDPRSGDTIWTAAAVGSAAPIVTLELIVGGGCRGVVAFDAERGRELWRHDTGDCIASGLLAVGGGFVAIDTVGRAVALEPAVGGTTWSLDRLGGARHRPALAFGTLLVPGDDGRLRGIDAVGGVERWSAAIGPRVSGPVLAHDGIAYVGSVDGRLVAVNAINGELLWYLMLGTPVRGAALGGGRLVVTASDGRTVALDLP